MVVLSIEQHIKENGTGNFALFKSVPRCIQGGARECHNPGGGTQIIFR